MHSNMFEHNNSFLWMVAAAAAAAFVAAKIEIHCN